VLGCVIFLGIGGHRVVLGGLLDTLRTVPLGGATVDDRLVPAVAGVLSASFVLAIKVAAPVVVTMLIVTVAVGMLGRTMPQINVLTVGLPVRTLVGLGVLGAILTMLLPLLERAVDRIGQAVIDLPAALT